MGTEYVREKGTSIIDVMKKTQASKTKTQIYFFLAFYSENLDEISNFGNTSQP